MVNLILVSYQYKITQFKIVNVNLSNYWLDKLKSRKKSYSNNFQIVNKHDWC